MCVCVCVNRGSSVCVWCVHVLTLPYNYTYVMVPGVLFLFIRDLWPIMPSVQIGVIAGSTQATPCQSIHLNLSCGEEDTCTVIGVQLVALWSPHSRPTLCTKCTTIPQLKSKHSAQTSQANVTHRVHRGKHTGSETQEWTLSVYTVV